MTYVIYWKLGESAIYFDLTKEYKFSLPAPRLLSILFRPGFQKSWATFLKKNNQSSIHTSQFFRNGSDKQNNPEYNIDFVEKILCLPELITEEL